MDNQKLNIILCQKDGTLKREVQRVIKQAQKRHRKTTPFSYVLRESAVNFRIDLYLSHVETDTDGQEFAARSFNKLDEIAQQIVRALEALKPPDSNPPENPGTFPLPNNAATAPLLNGTNNTTFFTSPYLLLPHGEGA